MSFFHWLKYLGMQITDVQLTELQIDVNFNPYLPNGLVHLYQ